MISRRLKWRQYHAHSAESGSFSRIVHNSTATPAAVGKIEMKNAAEPNDPTANEKYPSGAKPEGSVHRSRLSIVALA